MKKQTELLFFNDFVTLSWVVAHWKKIRKEYVKFLTKQKVVVVANENLSSGRLWGSFETV